MPNPVIISSIFTVYALFRNLFPGLGPPYDTVFISIDYIIRDNKVSYKMIKMKQSIFISLYSIRLVTSLFSDEEKYCLLSNYWYIKSHC